MQIVRIDAVNLTNFTTPDLAGVLKTVATKKQMVLELSESTRLMQKVISHRQAYEVGDRVMVEGFSSKGTVRYVGSHHKSDDAVAVMVELDDPVGINNGTVDGHQYYSLAPKHGVLANPAKVKKIERTITFKKGRSGFGLLFAGAKRAPDSGVFISGLQAEGTASLIFGIDEVIGWQIMAIDGFDLENATMDVLTAKLMKVKDTMEVDLERNDKLYKKFKKQKKQSMRVSKKKGPKLHKGTWLVTVEKGPKGFGILFGGAKNEVEAKQHGLGIFISGVKPGGAAESVESISTGPQIVTLNGVNTSKLHVGALPAILRTVKDKLVLELKENTKLRAAYAKKAKVKFSLKKGPKGFGIVFGGAKTINEGRDKAQGIVIKGNKTDVDHEGSAMAVPECWKHVGFQVVELNGVDVSTSTCEDLPAIMAKVKDTLSVVAEENRHLRSLYMPYFGTTPVEEIVVPVGPHGFGLEFGGAKDADHSRDTRPGVYIAEVAPGYPASSLAPRLVGKQVVMANGHDMTDSTLMDMMHVLSDVTGGELEHMILRVTTNKALASHSSGSGPVLTMVLTRKPGSKKAFGVKVSGPKNMAEGEKHGFGVFIEGLNEDSLASAQSDFKRHVGWQIVGLNGADCRHTTTTEFKAALKGVGNEMRLELQENRALKEVFTKLKAKRASAKTASKKAKMRPLPSGAITVTLHRGANGFGMQFGGAKDEAEAESNGFGIYVAQTKPGGSAFDEEEIVVGQQVLRLNEHDLFDATTEELQEYLKTVGNSMELALVENARLSNTYEQVNQSARRVLRASMWKDPTSSGGSAEEYSDNEDIIHTTVVKNDLGFGLRFGGPKTTADGEKHGFGVFVSGTKPGGAAEDNPDISIGFQVLNLNGVDLTNATTATLSEALTKVRTEMTLQLIENDKLFKTYTQPAKSSGERLGGRTRASVHHRKVKSKSCSVRLEKGTAGFGLKFGGAINEEEAKQLGFGVFISGTKPGGAAEKVEELEVGMQVLALNGTDLTKATTRELSGALRGVRGALELDLETNDELYEAYTTKKRHVSTTLKKGPEGFGMLFGGPKNKSVADKHGYGVYVSSCKPGGAAAANPQIQEDLQIIAINGINVAKGTLVDLAAALKKVSNELRLELAPNLKLAQTYNSIKTTKASQREKKSGKSSKEKSGVPQAVSLKKGPSGFGLLFGGAKNQEEVSKIGYGVYISGTKPGGVAEAHPGIKVGMQIVAIAGEDTSNATLKSLPPVLKKVTGAVMELVLVENAALFQKGSSLRAAAKATPSAEEVHPTSAPWYAGRIDTATCQAAVKELGVGAYLVNRTGATEYNLIICDEAESNGCNTKSFIHSENSGGIEQVVQSLTKKTESAVTGRRLPVHTLAVDLAKSGWWFPRQTAPSASKAIAGQRHGVFMVYPNGTSTYAVAVNDNGSVLTIQISDLTVDLASSGCKSRGKFLQCESIYSAVRGLQQKSAAVSGKSGKVLPFDVPAAGGSFHETALEELVDEEEAF